MGLSTAICLAEAGASVAVAAAELSPQTTSIAAGAVWGPHLVGKDDRIIRWADVTRTVLVELSEHGLPTFVRLATGIAAGRDEALAPPELAADGDATRCEPADIPPGYRSAWRLTAPVVSMPGHLDYLQLRFGRAGGRTPFPSLFSSL